MSVELANPIVVPIKTSQADLDQFWKMHYIEQINKGNREKENNNVKTGEHGKG